MGRCSPRSSTYWAAVVTAACFGISKTAHRRFLIWSGAGVWGRLHEEILHRLDDAGLLDLSPAVLDSAHIRAKRRTHRSEPLDRAKPGSKMQVLSDAAGLPLLVGLSAANTHDGQALKSIMLGHQTRRDPHRAAATSSPGNCTPMLTAYLNCGNGHAANASSSASPARVRHRYSRPVRAAFLGCHRCGLRMGQRLIVSPVKGLTQQGEMLHGLRPGACTSPLSLGRDQEEPAPRSCASPALGAGRAPPLPPPTSARSTCQRGPRARHGRGQPRVGYGHG